MILNGLIVANQIYEKLKIQISQAKASPKLVVIIVGNDPASQTYVKNKHTKAQSLGFTSSIINLPETINTQELINIISSLNNDTNTHGILVQLPLPKHIDTNKVILSINPSKDVDGIHPYNFGKLLMGEKGFIPCTPKGIISLLQFYNISVSGKHVAILGRSNIVGKPLFAKLIQKNSLGNATVSLLHSLSKNVTEILKSADIIVAAIGKPLYVDETMISKDTIIIDVGINRIPDTSDKGYKIVGDVNFEKVKSICKAITPVPGGIGPLTIASLLENTWESFLNHVS